MPTAYKVVSAVALATIGGFLAFYERPAAERLVSATPLNMLSSDGETVIVIESEYGRTTNGPHITPILGYSLIAVASLYLIMLFIQLIRTRSSARYEQTNSSGYTELSANDLELHLRQR